MAMQTGKSKLLEKYGENIVKAAEVNRLADVRHSDMGLPAGIDNGIAQLTDCRVTEIKPGKENAGQLVFYAAAIVLEPVMFNGVKVAGLRTQISEPLYDTPNRKDRKNQADHIGWVQNIMKLLGADPKDLGAKDIENTMLALEQAKPYLRFRTWKGAKQTTGPYKDKEPMVNHVWDSLDDYAPSKNGQVVAVQDNSGSDPEPEVAASTINEVTADEADAGEAFSEFTPSEEEVAELLVRAMDKDGAAHDRLKELAISAGYEDYEVDAADSWGTVAEMIRSPKSSEDGEGKDTADVDADFEPEKDVACHYRPIDPKTKVPVPVPINVVVQAVQKRTRTVDLKSLDNPRLKYEKVSWDRLTPA